MIEADKQLLRFGSRVAKNGCHGTVSSYKPGDKYACVEWSSGNKEPVDVGELRLLAP